MQLTLHEVAGILQTSENNVYRWINERNLPAEHIGGRYRFNRLQLLEWAALQRVAITPAAFAPNGDFPALARLDDALRTGGILHGLPGVDRPSVLEALFEKLPLPADCDRRALLQMTLAREVVDSTGIGDGIALPHPRFPLIHPSNPPSLTIAFLKRSVDFAALDSQPVQTLFAIISPTARIHSAMLARVAFALRQPDFRECIRKQAPTADILEQVGRLEERLQADEDAPKM
jgi:nitrogen PTS system EIIA component